MFRQLAHIALIFCLLLVTSGMTVYQHYCHGNLVEASLLHPPKSCCDGPCDCCNDEAHTYQLKEDFVFFTHVIDFDLPVLDIPVLQFNLIQHDPIEIALEYIPISHPPPNTGATLALLQVYCL